MSLPTGPNAQNPVASNPMFGRPIWSYTTTERGPARGPNPKLSVGTGKTSGAAKPGTQASLPGYVTENDYRPTEFYYSPSWRNSFLELLPRSIHTGENGRETVGTYQPHDVTIGQRFLHQMRRAPYWQEQEFPPNYRNLYAWQQVQKYRNISNTLSARVLDSSDYFLGYTIDPSVAASIGQTSLGYMGSQ